MSAFNKFSIAGNKRTADSVLSRKIDRHVFYITGAGDEALQLEDPQSALFIDFNLAAIGVSAFATICHCVCNDRDAFINNEGIAIVLDTF